MMTSAVKWGVAAVTLAWAGAAGAVPLVSGSSLALGANSVVPDPGDLTMATSFASPTGAFYSVGSGSFTGLAGVPSPTTLLTFSPNPVPIPASTGPLTPPGLSISGSGSASGFGTFTGTSVTVIMRTVDFLDVILMGTYSPNFGGYDANEAATLRIDVDRFGDVPQFGGTLTVTPQSNVPEPVSMVLLGSGLLGLGLARRRTKK